MATLMASLELVIVADSFVNLEIIQSWYWNLGKEYGFAFSANFGNSFCQAALEGLKD